MQDRQILSAGLFCFLAQIETAPHFSMIFDGDTEKAEMIAEHLMWLHSIRRERPFVSRPYKVGIYMDFVKSSDGNSLSTLTRTLHL